MKSLIAVLSIVFLLTSCKQKKKVFSFENQDKSITVNFELSPDMNPFYTVMYKDSLVLNKSYLGLIREDTDLFSGMEIIDVEGPLPIEENYQMYHGKQQKIHYRANEYLVHLRNENGNFLDIQFRLSDDGLGFRYVFPDSTNSIKKIKEEKTTYNFVANTRAWLQPMSRAKTGWSETNPSYEEHYLMDVPVDKTSPIGEGWVYPALFKVKDIWLLISETGLDNNYCGTRLKFDEVTEALKVTFPQQEEVFPGGNLTPESSLPWSTPWRIISIGSLATITESTLGTDLAIPAIEIKTGFIKSGLASWSWALLKDDSVNYNTSKEFIDYASSMHWPYCLIDVNWDTTIGYDKIKELADYAAVKNVKLIVWYNSSGSWNSTPYHPKSKLLTHADREREFSKLREMGIAGVKVDFFGGDGQSMIAYYHNILLDAAEHNLLVNFHGATLPRGWQRTYPHLMTVEAIKGEEFITFEQENADKAPSHCALIPFTRNVFDPMDFTPMVLDSIPNITKRTSDAFDLALPIMFLSGIQHIAETPMGMAKQPDYIIDYLKDIPTNWDESKFVDGYPGKYVVIARKKDETWYIVGINGEHIPKDLELNLSFLPDKDAVLIKDGESGFVKKVIHLPNTKDLKITIKPYGGFVIKV